MENFFFGFYLGMSLILAIGPQNLFVIEQGLKRNHVFLVCFICSISDLIFITIGPAAFYYFSQSNPLVDLILNLLLLIFILNFIWNKLNYSSHLYSFNEAYIEEYIGKVVLKTLAFTYLNPHVYSDTIFIIGGFSRELIFNEKIFFVIGASTASFIYFFSLGYASSYFASFINNLRGWRLINIIVIFSMVFLAILITHKILTIIRSIT
jgi:L-lysine exporter family protein LysE/ArgO